MALACHVISQDHMTKASCDFMGRSPLRLSHHLPTFGGHSRYGRVIM